MNNNIGFGSFSTQFKGSTAYDNFRILKKALETSGTQVKINFAPLESIDTYAVTIDHSNQEYEKKLKKAAGILAAPENNVKTAIFKLAKLLEIPKKELAISAKRIKRTIHYKKQPLIVEFTENGEYTLFGFHVPKGQYGDN